VNVAVFGLGYVGSVTAACLARDGHDVIAVDIDAEKVRLLNVGQSPVVEPHLEELVASGVRAGRLRATMSPLAAVRHADLALVTVGTPSESDGSVSIAAVRRAVEQIGLALRKLTKPFGIVVRSTLLPGVLEEELRQTLQAALGKTCPNHQGSVWLANNPEFLREGSAVADYDRPPFLIVGADEPWQAQMVLQLYERVDAPRWITDPRTAALLKYACNAFHALKVAFANEIGALAAQFGADGHRVMELLCKDDKLNLSPAYLKPGFCFGGSCLPKDVRALVRVAEQVGSPLPLLSAILPSNESHFRRAVERIRSYGLRRVGLMGLAFKPGTDDLRESPQVLLAATLIREGFLVRIYDPHVHPARLRGQNLSYAERHLPNLASLLTDNLLELFQHAELMVICTDVVKPEELVPFEGEVLDLRVDLARPRAWLGQSPQGGAVAYVLRSTQ
jgi:GDP-mannose 6-dehydrogenase